MVSHAPQFETAPGGLSKRAAQRLIQRAIVLAGRNRNVKQQIREADLVSVWSIEDWDLEWAVTIRRGKLDFDRRLPRRPDIQVHWPTAQVFFDEAEKPERSNPSGARYEGPVEARRMWDVLHQAFRVALGSVLENPVDEDGTRLA
jgi:hypothetical protein